MFLAFSAKAGTMSLYLPRSAPAALRLRQHRIDYRLLRLDGEPPLTRMLVRHLATAHWYDISAARRDLGYEPAVSLDGGFERLREWFAAQ